MKILHTSDWHLGRHLGDYSRLPEQAEFMDELADIVGKHAIDLVLVAGDIYDTHNPPAEAERLFYDTLLRLTHVSDKKVPVIVIAGNHDSPERLTASAPLSALCGALVVGVHGDAVKTGAYDGFTITDAGPGYFEILLRGESAVIVTLPYPSERRLNMLLTGDAQQSYSEKIIALLDGLSTHFREDTINIITGHFYIAGGILSADSERAQLGGAYAVAGNQLPAGAQYIAMGHLHRPQVASGHPCAYYAGSPIQYSASETGYAKCVLTADLYPGKAAQVEKIYLRNYKPIERWRTGSIAEAIALTAQRGNEHSYVFLEIETDRPITQSELKALKTNKRDIIEILPIMPQSESEVAEAEQTRSLTEMFTAFYREKRNAAPSEALVSLFLSLSASE